MHRSLLLIAFLLLSGCQPKPGLDRFGPMLRDPAVATALQVPDPLIVVAEPGCFGGHHITLYYIEHGVLTCRRIEADYWVNPLQTGLRSNEIAWTSSDDDILALYTHIIARLDAAMLDTDIMSLARYNPKYPRKNQDPFYDYETWVKRPQTKFFPVSGFPMFGMPSLAENISRNALWALSYGYPLDVEVALAREYPEEFWSEGYDPLLEYHLALKRASDISPIDHQLAVLELLHQLVEYRKVLAEVHTRGGVSEEAKNYDKFIEEIEAEGQ